jgi:hypothetical protein
MGNANEQVLAEKKAQADFWFIYRAANVAAFVFICILSANEHNFAAFFFLAAQICFNVVFVPKKLEEFDERLKHVTFKTQIFNLYVTTLEPGQHDKHVTATFNKTVEYLRSVGNRHGVKVHLLMYGDVNIYTKWVDPNGRIQTKITPRQEGCTWQTFDEYLQDVEDFKRADHEARLRELRKDSAGFEWVNRYVFEQDGEGE